MRKLIRGQVITLFSLVAAMAITLAACGGGGSSAGGGGGNIKAATVSGTVNSGSTAGVSDGEPGTTGIIAALSDWVIATAHAGGQPGVQVVVTCDGVAYPGVTDANGKFRIDNIPFTGACSTTFDGVAGPDVNVAVGMETEVEVSIDAGTVILLSSEQKPDSSTSLEIEVEDGASTDSIASNDDLSSDDVSSTDAPSEDSDDTSTASNDDGSSDGTSGSG